MKITIDSVMRAFYIRFDESPIVSSEEVKPGLVLDYDEDNRIIGIELLNMDPEVMSSLQKNVSLEVVAQLKCRCLKSTISIRLER